MLVSSANQSHLNQKFVDEMDDPDQACRLMEERITKLEKEKKQAGKNEEEVKRLAEEE